MNHTRRTVNRLAAVSVVVGLLTAGCTTGQGSRGTDDDRYPYWEKGAGASDAVEFMNLELPQSATQVKGAVRVQPQERVYLLSFLTSEETAESIADDLRSEHPLKADPDTDSLSGDGFEHLGLTSPQDIKGVRTTGVCPPCVGDERRSNVQGMEIHVGQDSGDRVRVYLAAY
ncbi:hypothetical protein [Streptomyces albipurpureus]|uniref:Lipoprotein n=1 Tax=Streptomyces albipurpureus TaxID=2897419 RepID=A0ABT0UXZ0_9ACTN|nr:hypothetical protein [Streptomyces sp. CWNU-1]MCM2393111.1 hypothetical protein [Streptomyces sp. CWNU-1]